MEEIKCNGCTACCRWGKDLAIRPHVTDKEAMSLYTAQDGFGNRVMAADKDGNCIYLEEGGCSIHPDRPSACRTFDCRLLYQQLESMSGATFIKVALKGAEKLNESSR